MDIVLANISAIEYWRKEGTRQWADNQDSAKVAARVQEIISSSEPKKGKFPSSKTAQLSRPLHYITSSTKHRIQSLEYQGHIWSHPVLGQSVVFDSAGDYVCTPEFALLQMASKFNLIELTYFICELCGTYAFTSHDSFTAREHPLSTLRTIKNMTESQSFVKGSRKIKRALEYAFENSASPMETVLALVLSLPCNCGGYGLPKPLLNYRVDFPVNFVGNSGKRFCKCDLFWPEAHLAVEYDSDNFHAYAQKMTADAMRRNDLEAVGISMITATSRQIFNVANANALASSISRKLKKKIRPGSYDYAQKQRELRTVLSNLLHNPPCVQ